VQIVTWSNAIQQDESYTINLRWSENQGRYEVDIADSGKGFSVEIEEGYVEVTISGEEKPHIDAKGTGPTTHPPISD
jgi:hypothetical protein